MLNKKNNQARHNFKYFFEKSVLTSETSTKYYIVQNYLYRPVIVTTRT